MEKITKNPKKGEGFSSKKEKSNLLIDKDIEELSIEELRQQYMQRRIEAKKAIATLSTRGNDNCWDDLLKTIENLLPEPEKGLFKLGKFNMCKTEILSYCKKWIDFQESQGNVLPDIKDLCG